MFASFLCFQASLHLCCRSALGRSLYQGPDHTLGLSLRLDLTQSEVWWPVLPHALMASDWSLSVGYGHRRWIHYNRLDLIQSEVWWPVLPDVLMASDWSLSAGYGHRRWTHYNRLADSSADEENAGLVALFLEIGWTERPTPWMILPLFVRLCQR